MNLTNKIALNTAAQIGGRLIGTALSLISIGVLTRYLGPSHFGEYSIAFLYAAVASTLADFGIYSIGLREMSAHPDNAYKIASLVVRLKTIIQTALFGIMIIIALLLPYSEIVKLSAVLALLGGLIATYINSINLYFQYSLKLYLGVLIELVVKIVSVCLVVWLAIHNADMLTIVAVNPIAMVIGLLTGLFILYQQKYPLKKYYDHAQAVSLLKESWPLGLVTILGYMHFKVDTIILSFLKSASDVGIYSVAYKVIEIIVVLPAFYTAAVFPILSQYWAQKDERFGSAVQKSFDFMCLVGLPLMFGIIGTASGIIRFISGNEFTSATWPLQVLMFAVFFSFLNNLFSTLAIVMNLQRKIVWVTMIALVSNILLNLILIQLYSYRGAAITTVITEGIACILTLTIVRPHLTNKISLTRFWKLLGIAFIMLGTTLGLSAIGINMFIVIAVGAVVYGSLVVMTKAISAAELKGIIQR